MNEENIRRHWLKWEINGIDWNWYLIVRRDLTEENRVSATKVERDLDEIFSLAGELTKWLKDRNWKRNKHESNCDVNNRRETIFEERKSNVDH